MNAGKFSAILNDLDEISICKILRMAKIKEKELAWSNYVNVKGSNMSSNPHSPNDSESNIKYQVVNNVNKRESQFKRLGFDLDSDLLELNVNNESDVQNSMSLYENLIEFN